jgi:putative phosphoribosyl transferase
MNEHRRFADRAEAAEALAAALWEYRNTNPLVLGIPRGGVPMAKVIADRLHGEIDIVLVHKLGAPFDPEYAIGAIDETGWTTLQHSAARRFENFPFFKTRKAEQLALLKDRRRRYTPDRGPVNPQGRIAIVVDDGIATGSTMIAALHAVRVKEPAELVCAIPVAPRSSVHRIESLADRVICLYMPDDFMAVGQFYRDFSQVNDRTVTEVLGGRTVNP